MKNNFLIGIPTFNEEASILDVLKRIKSFISKNNKSDCNFSVVFYDDGSTDNTVQSIKENSDFNVIVGKTNKGLGHAMKNLFLYAKEKDVDGLIKLDGDGQMDPQEIPLFVKNSKMIQVTSYTEIDSLQTQIIKCPLQRKLGSRFFRLFFLFWV